MWHRFVWGVLIAQGWGGDTSLAAVLVGYVLLLLFASRRRQRPARSYCRRRCPPTVDVKLIDAWCRYRDVSIVTVVPPVRQGHHLCRAPSMVARRRRQ